MRPQRPYQGSPRFPIKMADLDPNDYFGIFPDYFFRFLNIHLIEVVLGRLDFRQRGFGAAYTIGCNVQKSQDSCFGLVDYLLFKLWEVPPSGGSRINNGGNACLRAKIVWRYAVDPIRKFSGPGPYEYMRMDVDKARAYIQTGRVDDLFGVFVQISSGLLRLFYYRLWPRP